MKPFATKHFKVGQYAIVEMTGDKGAAINYNFTVAHEQEQHPNIILYMRGHFTRFRMDNPDEALSFFPGDTNDKIGARKAGLYQLAALADDSLHYCVRRLDRTRPKHERLRLTPDQGTVLRREQLLCVISGEVQVSGQSIPAPRFIYAESGDKDISVLRASEVHIFG